MKKTRLSTILLLVLTLLCSIFILASCGGGGGNNGDDPTPTPTPSTPTKLTAPTVVLTDDTATWSADTSADKFEISVDGNLSYIENSVTSRKLTDGQTFKIRAIGDGTNYTNSDWSNSVTYAKPIPKYTITWKNGDTVLETDTEVSEGTVPTYDGAEPTKAADAQYSYVFAGWSPGVVEATKDTTYTAVFNSVPHKCTVTWKNGDSVLETDENVEYGTTPTYDGVEPTKAADAQYSYVFAGWTPEVVTANGDVTYTAVFTSVLNKYTVTWKNGDTTLETDKNVEYGTMPTYNGAEPQKAADAQYVYVFSGWSPVVSEVVGNVTYVAQFTSAPNSYTIVWKNGDSTLETDENVVYGTTPSYDGATPTKDATAQYTYTFSGWTPQISSVTGSVTYQAQFTETLRSYTVTFYAEDGLTVLDTVTVEYGSNAVYSKSTPVKNATAGHTYVFEKWVTTQGGSVADDLTNVIGDRSVYASFKEFVRTVTVYIVSNNTDYGTVSVSTLNNVPYGATITVNGNTATINGQTVTANANATTAQYTYTFTNWTADATVGSDTIITANFSRSVNSYTVTWKNGNDTLETDENVAYGTTPVYNGETPTQAADAEYTYTFSGWNPSISSVTGDITYYAQFTNSVNKYTVTFYDDDGITVLGTSIVAHGEAASYANSLPTKNDTAQYAYVFDKWVTVNGSGIEAVLTNVTSNMNVYALYKATTRTYSVRILTSNDAYGSVSMTILNNIPYGTEIILNGNSLSIGENTVVATVTTSTPQYTYSFSNWTAVNIITEDTAITANFTRSANKYTVVWKNGEETLEKDENVEYGLTPIYNGTMPTKPSNAEYSYTFSGWSPSISPVTGDVTYYAQFTDATNKYTVTFYDDDGSTVLNVVAVDYGQKAEFSHSNPTKPSTAQYSYTFNKWVTEKDGNIEANLTSVTSNVSVYASYTSSVRTYSVQITTNNVNYGTVSKTILNDIPYGTEIVSDGNSILIGNTTVVAIATANTAQYTYSFSSWTANTSITGDTVITANFVRSTNKYTVTWKNGEETLEKDDDVEYGATPVYNGETPTKPSDAQYTYTFNGWTPSVSAVTGNVTYSAVFTSIINKYTVLYYDEDGSTLLGSVTVEHGKNAEYPNPLPAKASTDQYVYSFDKWVTATGGTTEAKLTNICENTSVYAKYSTNARTYVVTFCDYDGTILSQIDVAYGNAATAPGDPEREGYRFDGWNKAYSNITGDLTVKATYVQQFTVEFLDYDNSVIDTQLVDYNGSATAPENPTRNNYRFTGWNTGFSNVVHDFTVKAEYIRQYKVTFLDYDETVLKEVTVDAGSTAVAPSNPSKEGYTFDGWDKAFTNVSSDLIVTATYKVKTYTVKFVMPDGTIIGEAQSVEHGFSAIAPEYPEISLVGTGIDTKVYSFTRWDKTFDRVTEDLVIEALYDTVYTKPVIIVDFGFAPHTNTNVYIYSHSSITLNAVEFEIKYKTSVGEIEMNSVTFAGVFKENPQYVINNNEKKFSYAWSNAEGISYDNCARLLTFDLDVIVGGTTIGEDTFVIEACNIIVSDSNGENLEKITPVVVYR